MLQLVVLFAFVVCAQSQTLNLPARPANAPGGNDFAKMITPLALPTASDNRAFSAREAAICGQILQGNVPNWMRQMTLVTTNSTITGTNHTVSYYVTTDYFAVGSDTDYFLMPMTPLLGQFLADKLGCSLPTAKMVNDIWRKAPCKLSPSTIPPSSAMVTVPVFITHNNAVRTQRFAVTNSSPLGTLTGGDKKDVVIANKIYTNFSGGTKPVVIYGWHQSNGSPIQPVYNGHEETYADYSHGIRLVQMNITVDGQAAILTNILKGTLAPLLSDDIIYSGNVIPTPRYPTFSAAAPIITMHPFSQTVFSNSTVCFNAFAIGSGTLSYQWKLNGSNVPGATNVTMTLTNVQAANAGTYTVAVSNSSGSTTSIPALLKMRTSPHPALFSDSFETNSSTNWTVRSGSGNGVPDHTVDWAFDYSRESYTFNGAGYFIPPAPNSGGTTRGVKLTVNNGDTNGVIAAVNLHLKNKTFSNDFALKFDLWMNYPGGAGGINSTGSTEHALCGINHFGTQPNWAATTASSTDGIWFAVDGEGGTDRDYRAYVGNVSGVQTELLGPGSGLSQSNSTLGIYPTVFPASRFESVGAPGKNWVEVELRQVNGVITWLMNGTAIAQRTNTSSFTSGAAMIGYMDVFTSIANPADDAFVIFDNVRVEDLMQTLQPPGITTPPQNKQCGVGTNISFTVVASGSAPLSYQWFFNGAALSGATSQTLQITSAQFTNAGTYSVLVSNAVGIVNASATLTVLSQFQGISRNEAGQTQLTFTGAQGSSYTLETSTNLILWETLASLVISNTPSIFTDIAATNFFSRFYRARNGP